MTNNREKLENLVFVPASFSNGLVETKTAPTKTEKEIP
ncbi:MAG: hypothetical protein ACI9UK_000182 [Candidatus Krumholzibacteriia bacterium]|jgi:hypothetical protein